MRPRPGRQVEICTEPLLWPSSGAVFCSIPDVFLRALQPRRRICTSWAVALPLEAAGTFGLQNVGADEVTTRVQKQRRAPARVLHATRGSFVQIGSCKGHAFGKVSPEKRMFSPPVRKA